MPRRAPTTHKTTVRRNHRPGVLWAFAAALVGLPAAVVAAQFVVDPRQEWLGGRQDARDLAHGWRCAHCVNLAAFRAEMSSGIRARKGPYLAQPARKVTPIS